MLTVDGHSAVDAAHIVPWSVTHNDDPRNGMALCRLCHWTFDEGLTSVSAKYTMLLHRTAAPGVENARSFCSRVKNDIEQYFRDTFETL